MYNFINRFIFFTKHNNTISYIRTFLIKMILHYFYTLYVYKIEYIKEVSTINKSIDHGMWQQYFLPLIRLTRLKIHPF